jgi:hypothetical protein
LYRLRARRWGEDAIFNALRSRGIGINLSLSEVVPTAEVAAKYNVKWV